VTVQRRDFPACLSPGQCDSPPPPTPACAFPLTILTHLSHTHIHTPHHTTHTLEEKVQRCRRFTHTCTCMCCTHLQAEGDASSAHHCEKNLYTFAHSYPHTHTHTHTSPFYTCRQNEPQDGLVPLTICRSPSSFYRCDSSSDRLIRVSCAFGPMRAHLSRFACLRAVLWVCSSGTASGSRTFSTKPIVEARLAYCLCIPLHALLITGPARTAAAAPGPHAGFFARTPPLRAAHPACCPRCCGSLPRYGILELPTNVEKKKGPEKPHPPNMPVLLRASGEKKKKTSICAVPLPCIHLPACTYFGRFIQALCAMTCLCSSCCTLRVAFSSLAC